MSVPPDFHRAYDAPQRNDALVRVIWIQASPTLIFPASAALYNQLRQLVAAEHGAPACDVQTLIREKVNADDVFEEQAAHVVEY